MNAGGGARPVGGIRGLIFDFGGVLWNMRWDVREQLEEGYGLPPGALFETLYRTATWAEIQCGRGDRQGWLDEAHALLETKAGRGLPRLHVRWRQTQHLIEENVALVRALRPPYRTAILSNADMSLRDRVCANGIQDLFDALVCSAEAGIAKPDPEIYCLAAARLELRPDACVFVDDSEANVTAAREVGMRSVWFHVERHDDLGALLAALGVRPRYELDS